MTNSKKRVLPVFYLSVLLCLLFGRFHSLCGVGDAIIEKLAEKLEAVFAKQAEEYKQSMNEFAQTISEAMATHLKEVVDHIAGNGTNMLFEHLDENFAQNSKGEAALKSCLDTVFNEIEAQFQQEGKGAKVIEHLLNEIEMQFQQDGKGAKVIEQLCTALRAEYSAFLLEIAQDRDEFFKEGGKFQELIWNAEKQAIDPANDFMMRVWQKNWLISGAMSIVVVAGATAASYATKLWIDRHWIRPQLVTNSSNKSFFQKLKNMLCKKKQAQEMVFEKDLEIRLHDIVRTTQIIYQKINSGASNVSYRNLLVWGASGTGKTMFVKRLAQESGLDLAYIPGSSFSKFKDGEGIEALDGLFKWANKSKGLMIFIDEAEAFLAKRESMDPNSKAYQLLNNFLNYTGERSNKFMIVFATNQKNSIDSAMHRRIDDLVELPLPKTPERARVLALYRDSILLDVKQNGQEFVDSAQQCLNDDKINEIAHSTQGLSNGDLEGIINTIKTDADSTDSGLVNATLIDRVVQRAIEKHQTLTASINNKEGVGVQAAIAA